MATYGRRSAWWGSKAFTLSLGSFLLFSSGCATIKLITEGDKRVNEQTLHAGRMVKTAETLDEARQAGSDVEANSRHLADVLGYPKRPALEYSQELSEEAREDAQSERAAMKAAGLGLLDMLPGVLPLGGMAGSILALLLSLMRNKRLKTTVRAMITGVEKAREDIDDKEKAGDVAYNPNDVMADALQAVQEQAGVRKEIQELRGKR